MDLLFDEKCIIFVLAKRRMPIDKGFSPLFLCENGRKNHCFTKHLEKFICRSGFSKCFCGNFSGQVAAHIDDIEIRKVKRYLFSTLHFYHFKVMWRSYCKAMYRTLFVGVWLRGKGSKNWYNKDQDTSPFRSMQWPNEKTKGLGARVGKASKWNRESALKVWSEFPLETYCL